MRKKIFFLLMLCIAVPLAASPIKLFEAGKELQYRENWYGAVELYQQALKENPAYNAVYRGLAECFYALGEYDQAIVYVEKARRYAPQDVDIENLYAFILIGIGKVEEAQKIFSAVLNRYPNNLDARFGMAEIEVSGGRLTNASELYTAALRRQSENRKALLSLALLSYETGNTAAAHSYTARALQYHGDNAQVHYFAGYLAALAGNMSEAEGRIRAALTINEDYDRARALLCAILYSAGRYREALDISDLRIAGDRKRSDAWYLKTLCLVKLEDNEGAFESARTGLAIDPENELMRTLLEDIAVKNLEFEDDRRKTLSQVHSTKGAGFVTRNMTDQALYEYRRALKVYPYDAESRQAYAKILMRQGFPERAIQQLEFIQSIEKSNARINDIVEAYSKTLEHSVRKRWNIDSLYLDKSHLSIGLFYQVDSANVFHPEAEKLTAGLMSDIMAYNRRFDISAHLTKPHSYMEAFRQARTASNDYFGILSVKENERDVQITLDVYVGRTGSKAETLTVYRSGNDRLSNALRRITDMFNTALPVIGSIAGRSQAEAVIDIGSGDCNLTDCTVEIIKQGTLTIANEGIGLLYNEKDILGTFTIGRVSEDLTEGTLTRKGYYDKMTRGDMAVIIYTDAEKEKARTGSKAEKTTDGTDKRGKEMSHLLSLLRSIR
ncbi:MAG: tetratricopeptide repeat protein [Treponema sp.]